MTSDEIEQILRIQWAATHPMDRAAYDHDYYYQCWLNTNNKGKLRAIRPRHAPRIAPQAKEARAPTAFVALEGMAASPSPTSARPSPSSTSPVKGRRTAAAGARRRTAT